MLILDERKLQLEASPLKNLSFSLLQGDEFEWFI